MCKDINHTFWSEKKGNYKTILTMCPRVLEKISEFLSTDAMMIINLSWQEMGILSVEFFLHLLACDNPNVWFLKYVLNSNYDTQIQEIL